MSHDLQKEVSKYVQPDLHYAHSRDKKVIYNVELYLCI